jgi:hypothetical protein
LSVCMVDKGNGIVCVINDTLRAYRNIVMLPYL